MEGYEMTRTKQKLVEFIKSCVKKEMVLQYGEFFPYRLADELILEGWVEVDKPREWWICPQCFSAEPANYGDAGHDEMHIIGCEQIDRKPKIFVREILDSPRTRSEDETNNPRRSRY